MPGREEAGPARRLILNADDLGLSPGVNRGILRAFRRGVVSSTTMLVNLPGFGDAVTLARQNPDLPTGIHLSLLWGRPVSDVARVPALVDRRGYFPRSLAVLTWRYGSGRLSLDQVRLEFGSQVRRFLEAGREPTHLDTHKHIHCLPGILGAVLAIAREFGIERVRLPRERVPASGEAFRKAGVARPSWRGRAKRVLAHWLSRNARARLQADGIRTTDHFVGINHSEQIDSEALIAILRGLPDGTTEIACHPGYLDEGARAFTSASPNREAELRALEDPRVADEIARTGIHLIDFREV